MPRFFKKTVFFSNFFEKILTRNFGYCPVSVHTTVAPACGKVALNASISG